VAVEASTYSTGRRGVAGTMIVEKIIGAAAERGEDLAACRTLGERVNKATRSMGVALTSCTVPAAGKPTFQLGDDEIEIGVGIHGEPGRRRAKMTDADTLSRDMITAILDDLAASGQGAGDSGEVLLLVNGFGATPLMELYVMYHAARARIEARGLTVTRSLVGNYVTALDMAGCSLTVTALDRDMLTYWDAPVHTAALRWGR
jgi:dihydroxyacetone kinase-like protein